MPAISLDQLDIATPCPASWDEMSGDHATRFCNSCQKQVHNLSAMPRDRAEQLVCQSAGDLCVRFARAHDGQVMTLDYRPLPVKRGWSWPLWSVIALAGALIAGVVNAAIFGDRVFPPQQQMIVGALPVRQIPTNSTSPNPTNTPADMPKLDSAPD